MKLFVCVCICMGHRAYFSHFSVVGEANCKNKARSYLGFDMSRITCSIECAAYYLLITFSALYTLSCPCSMASSHCPSHSTHTYTHTPNPPPGPLSLSFNTYKTEKIQSGLGSGHLEAAMEFSPCPLPGTSPTASCSIVSS